LVRTPAEPESVVTYVSPQIESWLGHDAPPEEVDAREYWRSVIHPDDFERVMVESDRTVSKGGVYREEFRVVAADGRVLWVHDESILVRTDPDGSDHGVILGITERRRRSRRSCAVRDLIVCLCPERFLS
jgi:PAS domain S-box-containing protein